MKRKTLLSWSSGKDSAWALHVLRQNPDYDVSGLFCTVNKAFNRVAMHAVRIELLRQQAESVGLPLHLIEIPYPCSHDAYAQVMTAFVASAKAMAVECFAFGDLFLEDVRRYREDNMIATGITPVFPLWGMPTAQLSQQMVNSGLRAVITSVDPRLLSCDYAGREFNASLLRDLPAGVDPCGENGEFHSFAFDGPMFQWPIETTLGEIVTRDGFVYADIRAPQKCQTGTTPKPRTPQRGGGCEAEFVSGACGPDSTSTLTRASPDR